MSRNFTHANAAKGQTPNDLRGSAGKRGNLGNLGAPQAAMRAKSVLGSEFSVLSPQTPMQGAEGLRISGHGGFLLENALFADAAMFSSRRTPENS